MLILTEKPSAAQAFAEALGVPRKDNFYENSGYCIVNALGHLLENYSPEDYDPALKNWELNALPIIPEKVKYKAVEKTKARLAVVKSFFNRRKNDPFLLATDAEREGELIGAEILDYVGFTNYSNAKRFWVSEALTPDVVLKGIENAKPLAEYKSYRDQGFARQRADWLVGMNLTRLLTLKSNKLLHFGRVQTAVLGAVFERGKAIQNFASEKYFEIQAVMGVPHFSVKMINPDNKELPSRFSAPPAEEILSALNRAEKGFIASLKKEKKTVQPPQLFNLTALQKEAHNQFGYPPEQTLNIAQALYEKHKCLSYPRTPSRVMGDDNVGLVKGVYNILKNEYAQCGVCLEDYLKDTDPSLINTGNKRLFNSAELQDHHALIPLEILPEGASDEEYYIYCLVCGRFLNILKPPYLYNSVSIDVDILGRKFIGGGIEVLNAGWKAVSNDNEDDEDVSEDYSALEQGKEYKVNSIETLEKQTEPKRHYTFASLLQLMENPRGDGGERLAGLGTPATRGAILQKLVDRKYVLLKGKSVIISGLGKFLIENVLKNELLAFFISIPETTRWEESLHENTAAFIDGIKDFVSNAVKNTGMDTFQLEKKPLGKCPLCGNDVYEGKKNYYCCNYKGKNPCRFSIWKEICGASVSDADAQNLLAGKKTRIKKCVSKANKQFNAAFKLEKDKVVFVFQDMNT
jgi:DNA topoisomerase-3